MRRERLLALLGRGLLAALALAEGEPVRKAALAARTRRVDGMGRGRARAPRPRPLRRPRAPPPGRTRRHAPLRALVAAAVRRPVGAVPDARRALVRRGEPSVRRGVRSHARGGVAPRPAADGGRGADVAPLARPRGAPVSSGRRCSSRCRRGRCSRAWAGSSRSRRGYFFADRADPRALKAAACLAALLFFLKYHFGFFALATFAAVLVLDEPGETPPGTAAGPRRPARPAAPVRGGRAPRASLDRACRRASRGLPSRRSGCRAAGTSATRHLLFLLAWGAFQRERMRASRASLGPSLRTFARWGLLAPALWLLIPGNVRAWYRQTIQTHPDPERNPLRQLAAFFTFLKDEYTWNVPDALPLVLVSVGLAAALARARGRDRTVPAMAWFAVWPVLLMSLNTWRVEARYLGVLVPCLLAVSAAGLVFLFARARPSVRPALALVAFRRPDRLRGTGSAARSTAEMASRAAYRFPNSTEEAAFVEAMRGALPGAGPARRRASPGAADRARSPAGPPPRSARPPARRRPRRAREPGEAPVAPPRPGAGPRGDRGGGVVGPARSGVAAL